MGHIATPMAATAIADIPSRRTPASSVDVLAPASEKYEAMNELPVANVAVAKRNSTPTSTAVLRNEAGKGLRTATAVALMVSSTPDRDDPARERSPGEVKSTSPRCLRVTHGRRDQICAPALALSTRSVALWTIARPRNRFCRRSARTLIPTRLRHDRRFREIGPPVSQREAERTPVQGST